MGEGQGQWLHQTHTNQPESLRGLPRGGDITVKEFELAILRLRGGKYPMPRNSEFKNQLEEQSGGQSMQT